jgi:hypothetical protein
VNIQVRDKSCPAYFQNFFKAMHSELCQFFIVNEMMEFYYGCTFPAHYFSCIFTFLIKPEKGGQILEYICSSV